MKHCKAYPCPYLFWSLEQNIQLPSSLPHMGAQIQYVQIEVSLTSNISATHSPLPPPQIPSFPFWVSHSVSAISCLPSCPPESLAELWAGRGECLYFILDITYIMKSWGFQLLNTSIIHPIFFYTYTFIEFKTLNQIEEHQ